MSRPQPIRAGFRAIGRTPALVPAEIAWRWAFGGAMAILVFFAGWFYLDSLAVTPADQLLLATGIPPLVSRAITHIFTGTGARLLRVSAVLAPGAILLWTVAAAAGRAFVLKSFRPRASVSFRALLGLSFLRAMVHVAALAAILGAAFIYARIANPLRPDAARPTLGAVVFVLLAGAAATAWWLTQILLVAAPVFADSGPRMGDALRAALADFRRQPGRWFWIACAFGFLHLFMFSGWFMFAPSFVSLSGVLHRGWVVLAAFACALLVYFAAVDALHIARFAAQLSIAEPTTVEAESRSAVAAS